MGVMEAVATRRVSVVIPTRNRPDFLRESVDSVIGQTCRPLEILVVDDGSVPAAVIPGDSGVTLIRQTHQGVSAARNAGIRAARGGLIAFLDDDDRWAPEKLERQVEFFARHPQAVAVQTEEIWVRNGRRIQPKPHHRKPNGQILPAALRLCLVSPSAVCIRRRIFDEIGFFDERLPACEDYDFWLRLGLRYPVHLIDEPLTIKRGGHADQLSLSWGLDRWRIESLLKFLSQPMDPALRDEALAVLNEKMRIYTQGCRNRNKAGEADEIVRRVAAVIPPSAPVDAEPRFR